MYRVVVTYLFLISLCLSESARILGVFPLPSFSHYAAPSALLRELANRGHEVTVLTSSPQKPPVKNLRDIDLSGYFDSLQADNLNLFDLEGGNVIMNDIVLHTIMINETELVFANEKVQELLNSKEVFDLVLMEDFAAPAWKGFAYRFKAPCIMVNSMGLSRLVSSQVGNPYNPSYMVDLGLPYADTTNFFVRLQLSLVYCYYQMFHHWYVLPRHNEILQKNFPGAPHISELYYNVSLLLVNAHVSNQQPVPYVPNVIDIGGIHVKDPKPLPKDLQEYLDTAQDGVIFFSMGSNLKSARFPKEKREALLKAFGKLKQRVLWKWEDENLPGKPPNVKVGKWLPQSDILAHPNVRLFITHGGLLSKIEAVHRGTPVLGIPIFGDQKANMANTELNGIGLTVPYSELNEELLSSKLQEVLTNPKYRENAKLRSKIMHDQPMTPVDRAVFWVEYVFRHKGAPHLRIAALDLEWYQYLLLDVILFMFGLAVTIVYLFYFILKKLVFSRRCSDKNKKHKND